MIPIARTPAFRLAPSRKNALYATFEDALRNVFFDSAPSGDSFDSSLYVAERIEEPADDQINPMIERLPYDIVEMYRTKRIGFPELDFLDFILNYDSNRVLLVLGSPGVGKSTFLRNISFHLQDDLLSLRAYRFIYVDFLQIDNAEISHNALLATIVRAALQAFKERLSSRDQERIIEFAQQIDARFSAANITDIHDFVFLLKQISNTNLAFIFDNVDQLAASSIAQITAVARSIFFATQQFVIVAQRPPSDSLRVEYARGKQTYFPFVLQLSPPVLYPLVMKRFLKALATRDSKFSDKVLSDTHEFPVTISKASERVSTYLRNVMSPRIQAALLGRLSNNNVRSALYVVDSFLKYHELSFNLLFDFNDRQSFPYEHGTRIQRPFNHFLKGAMVGERLFFTEDERLPISNIFYFEYVGPKKYEHILIYYILAICSEFNGYINCQTIDSYFSALDCPSQFILRTLAHLVRRGLLTSHDTDGSSKTPAHVKITEAGRYQVGGFVREPSYLLNVIYDVDVKVDSENFSDLDNFPAKVRAIGRLLHVVATEERMAFEMWRSSKDICATRALDIVCSHRPLSLILWQALLGMFRQRSVLRYSNVKHFNASLKSIRDEILADSEENLNWIRNVERDRLRETAETIRDQPKTQHYELLGVGSIELTHPRMLRAAFPNEISISFLPSFAIGTNDVLALWHSSSEQFHCRDYVRLTRTKEGSPFKGTLQVDNVDQDTHFPPRSDVRFFDNARELASMLLVSEAA